MSMCFSHGGETAGKTLKGIGNNRVDIHGLKTVSRAYSLPHDEGYLCLIKGLQYGAHP